MNNHLIRAIVAGLCLCAAVAAQQAAAVPPVPEIGAYHRSGDQWIEMLPEIVHWKTGGIFKMVATGGIVKGDINGHLAGPRSRNAVRGPAEILIYAPEGVAITEYQLIRLRCQKKAREFRTVTGGILHVSGGATRDLVPFEGRRMAPRTYAIRLSGLEPGEYGFLPPGMAQSSHASASLGKMYTFRLD